VGGGSISQLESHATFPDSPTVEKDAGYFEWPQSGDIDVKPEGNVMDNYGVQMIGFLHPPATGDYQFAIAADDNAQLWLSTDESPMNRQLIATEPQWNGIRSFAGIDRRSVVDAGTADERYQNVSKSISLEAGKAYYIEALMNEGGGGDNLAVAWTTGDPIANDALPISGEHLSPWVILEVVEIVDVSQPGDPVVPTSDNHPAGEHAGFAIDNDASTKYLNFDKLDTGLTISTGGGVVTGLGLTSANDSPDRDPASFVLSGSNDGGATFTEIASGDVAAFTARFERQELSFANETGYSTYHLIFPTVANEGGANSMQIAEIELIGTAWGIYNLGTTAPGSAAGSISLREFDPVGGTSIAELIAHPSFPDDPTLETGIGYFEWPQSGDIAVNPEGNVKDNYGAQLIGFLHPPETGDYQFALAADDNAQLWLSTDENPANRQLIAQETGWQPVRGYQAVGDEATSEFITLEGGKAYYIEALFNEGGGGDNIAVAWTTGDPVAAGALPIAGEFLSPWLEGAGGAAPTLSIVNNGDGTVTVTFEGKLQGASTVNGPWADVEGAVSPQIIPATEAQQYGRAVSD